MHRANHNILKYFGATDIFWGQSIFVTLLLQAFCCCSYASPFVPLYTGITSTIPPPFFAVSKRYCRQLSFTSIEMGVPAYSPLQRLPLSNIKIQDQSQSSSAVSTQFKIQEIKHLSFSYYQNCFLFLFLYFYT